MFVVTITDLIRRSYADLGYMKRAVIENSPVVGM